MANQLHELPPAAFSNAVNRVQPNFNFQDWRASAEWKLFVAGYNSALADAVVTLSGAKNMGESEWRVFEVRQ